MIRLLLSSLLLVLPVFSVANEVEKKGHEKAVEQKNMAPVSKDKLAANATSLIIKDLMGKGEQQLNELKYSQVIETFEEVLLLQTDGSSQVTKKELQKTHFILQDSYSLTDQLDKSLYHLEAFYRFSPNNPKTLKTYSLYLSILGSKYASLGYVDVAIKHYEKALSASIKIKDNDQPRLSVLRSYVGSLISLDRYKAAQKYQQIRINLLKEQQPQNLLKILSSERRIARIFSLRKDYKKAHLSLSSTLRLAQSNKVDDYLFITQLKDDIGLTLVKMRDYEGAKKILNESLEVKKEKFANDIAGIISTKTTLATIYSNINQPEKSESLFIDTVQLIEREISDNLNHLNAFPIKPLSFEEESEKRKITYRIKEYEATLSVILHNLASYYEQWGNNKKAIETYKKSLIFEKKNKRVGSIIETKLDLSKIHLKRMDLDEADKILKEVQKQAEAYYPANHVGLNQLYHQLFTLYLENKSYATAKLFLDKIERILNYNNNQVSLQHSYYYQKLAMFYKETGEYNDAIRYHHKSYEINRRYLSHTHPAISLNQFRLAQAYYKNTQIDQALEFSQKAIQTLQQYMQRQTDLHDVAGFHRYNLPTLLLLLQLTEKLPEKTPEQLAGAFKSLQLAHNPQRSKILAQTTLNLSVANKPKVKLALQTLNNNKRHWQTLNNKQVKISNAIGSKARKIFQDIVDEMSETEKEIVRLDRQLGDKLPFYRQLANPEPLELLQAQKLLDSDEALLAFLSAEKETYLFMVKHRQAKLVRLNISQQTLKEQINKLRKALPVEVQKSDLLAFDLSLAHQLYAQLLAPVETELKNINHLITVTDDTLQQLPFSVLISEKPTSEKYHEAQWLIKRFSLSQLPAINALPLLRDKLRASKTAPQAFIGFGDAVLNDQPSNALLANLNRGVLTNTDQLKQLPRLYDTAEELTTLANLTNSKTQNTVYLRERATETQIKTLSQQGDLAKHRYVAFASHALLAREAEIFNAPAEAGIVLTPPDKASEEDDGFLSSSEILNLKLNADMVLLSACNTANLTEANESGLSNLSKSFFLAGTRSLLASQWLAHSQSAKALTTGLIKQTTDKRYEVKHAEALRQSMLELMQQTPICNWLCQAKAKMGIEKASDNPPFAHPAYWAPFILIGDGR